MKGLAMTQDDATLSAASVGSPRAVRELLEVLENRGDREEWCERAAALIKALLPAKNRLSRKSFRRGFPSVRR
jgi:hypothetical protein